MTGILDGHNIEVGSTPIDRLDEDIATQPELENVINALNAEAVLRANADTQLQTNIDNLATSVNTNYVHKTGNIIETITGAKTFSAALTAGSNLVVQGDLTVNGTTTTVSSQDLTVSDNIILLNSGESGSSVSAGIAGIAIDRGSGDNYRILFDESVPCIKAGFIGNEKCLATKEYVDNQVGTSSGGLVALGTSTFAGQSSPRVINFTPDVGTRPYSVNITPSQITNADVGSYYYERVSGTQFKVYNTGDATTGFDWSVGVVGVLPAASGVAGGDLSGAYPDPKVVKIQNRAISNAAPTTGQALVWSGTEWAPSASAGSPGGPAGGDLNGTYPNPSVIKMWGRKISNATPSDGDVLTYISSTAEWTPQAPASGGATDLNGLSDVSITSPNATSVLKYDGAGTWKNSQFYIGWLTDVAIFANVSDGDVLTYNGTTFRWENKPAGGSSGGTIIAAGTAYPITNSGTTIYVTGVISSDKVVVSLEDNAQPAANGPVYVTGKAGNGTVSIGAGNLPKNSGGGTSGVTYVVIRP